MAKHSIKFRDPLILHNNEAMKVCVGCDHLGKAGFAMICEYILNTGHCRPCPAGADCTVNTTLKGVNKMRKKSWDENYAKQLHTEGHTDQEIADLVGASLGAITAWRHRNHLPVNGSPRRSTEPKEPPAPVATSEPPAAPVVVEPVPCADPPAEIPDQEVIPPPMLAGPVEISFSFAGCQVSLTAPDQRAAAWAAAYLSDMANSLSRERERRRRAFALMPPVTSAPQEGAKTYGCEARKTTNSDPYVFPLVTPCTAVSFLPLQLFFAAKRGALLP